MRLVEQLVDDVADDRRQREPAAPHVRDLFRINRKDFGIVYYPGKPDDLILQERDQPLREAAPPRVRAGQTA